MSETIEDIAKGLTDKAESIVKVKGSYQAIVQEVMMIGGKAMMSKSFTLAQAEYVAAAMIAAISLAKNGG